MMVMTILPAQTTPTKSTAAPVIDRILGGNGNDIITGGPQDDYLSGQRDDDIYRFSAGFGRDTIEDNFSGGTDVVEFDATLDPANMRVKLDQDTYSIVLSFVGTNDELTLHNTIGAESDHIELVRFADGTTFTDAELSLLAYAPTDGDDSFTGGDDADVLLRRRWKRQFVGSQWQ